MQIHLDLIGGMAGDMFIAAMLDAFPQHQSCCNAAIECLAPFYPVRTQLLPHSDGTLRGRRFSVINASLPRVPLPITHEHTSWKTIEARLCESTLTIGVRRHALGIFESLALAESKVHGVDPADVSFHEVGAWDSVADIVGAAALIDAAGATRWTCSPAPLGSGRVCTSHGLMPVPAPATVELLKSMDTIDDGIAGERVTPTGAAILRYLCPPADRPRHADPAARILKGSGMGFGARRLPGISNHLRVLYFEEAARSRRADRELDVLEFEIDDQSGEDLAAGLDRLRAHEAVLDVTQSCVYGKKGRMMAHVQVLARRPGIDSVIEACFRETTTIGMRCRPVRAIGLDRAIEEIEVDGHRLRVKVVDRPGGRTAKTECDDVLPHSDHAVRAALRTRGERLALNPARKSENA